MVSRPAPGWRGVSRQPSLRFYNLASFHLFQGTPPSPKEGARVVAKFWWLVVGQIPPWNHHIPGKTSGLLHGKSFRQPVFDSHAWQTVPGGYPGLATSVTVLNLEIESRFRKCVDIGRSACLPAMDYIPVTGNGHWRTECLDRLNDQY